MTTLGLRPGFIELGNIAHGEQPLEHSFEQIVQVPARVLPTSVEASITLISAGHPTPAAVSDSAADTLDETQDDTDRCPCLRPWPTAWPEPAQHLARYVHRADCAEHT